MPPLASPVVVAPFANERIKEWPIKNFRRFIELNLADDNKVVIVGTASQRARANELVRGFSSLDVVNTCGLLGWGELLSTVAQAKFVVANNSGVAHLGAKLGRWVLCVFGGVHSWIEWMPRGPRVVTITRVPSCSPCELGDQPCPNGLACLVHLDPEVAYAEIAARALVARD